MRKQDRASLTSSDWSGAALRAIGRGGVDAVAVEPLAVELGATKGSFYWHFKNREALIEAALDEWERRLTDNVIEVLGREPDPAQRLKKLFEAAFELGPTEVAAEIALLANPGYPSVRQRVRQVSRRRIAYMAQQLEALGWKPVDARDRAVLLSYVYVGYLQTAHIAPSALSKASRKRHVQVILNALVAADLSRPRVPA